MRTTLDIDEKLVGDVARVTGARTKRKAIEIALQEFLWAKRREELAALIDNYDDFDLTLQDLERMRNEP